MTSPSEAPAPGRMKSVWRYLLSFYIGKRGYRASLIAYGIGFWIFVIGIVLMLLGGEASSAFILVLRNLLLHIGLVILVMMTYPVLYCGFQATDMTRPASRFRRIFEGLVVAMFAPVYLMMLVASFMQYAAARLG